MSLTISIKGKLQIPVDVCYLSDSFATKNWSASCRLGDQLMSERGETLTQALSELSENVEMELGL